MSQHAKPEPFPWVPEVPPGEDELQTGDGEPMESARHRYQLQLLDETLRDHWHERDDFFSGGNMFVYFSETQVRRNDFRGPDFFVVCDTTKRERKAWVVWMEEGKTPDVVVELLSESTAAADRGEKKRIYERVLKVPEYYLYDPFKEDFEAYALATARYESAEPDAQGRYTSRALGLKLGKWRGTYEGIEATWIRWHTPEGQLIPTRGERADNEARRADDEARRADDEARRADDEAQRRREAEARIAELEQKLKDR